jgi:YbgC/YbaW family acyl-CoA thioester hydrolase
MEVDRAGVVFNANFLAYFDVAITEYWRAIGYPYPDGLMELEGGAELYVVKATVEYLAFALFDDILDICMRCTHIAAQHAISAGDLSWRRIDRQGELIYAHVGIRQRGNQPGAASGPRGCPQIG